MKKAEHTSKTILTPYISNIIKIIALLMMFCHHFLRTDSWLVNGNRYISLLTFRGYQMETILCDVGKLCVALFAILSGYGLYHSFNKNDSFDRVLNRLRDFICQYLMIFLLIFMPVFFLLGNRITLWGFMKSLLTLDGNMNMFSWYVHFYIMAVPVLWLLHKLYAMYPEFEKSITAASLLMAVVLPFVKVTWGGCLVSDFLSYFPSIIVGYFMAKYMLIELLGELVERFRWKKCLGIVCGGTVLLLRHFISRFTHWKIYIQFDAFLAFLFVFFMILVFSEFEGKGSKWVTRVGKATANMWYLHAIFFGVYAEELQWIAYLPKYSVLVVVWVFGILTIASLAVEKIRKQF